MSESGKSAENADELDADVEQSELDNEADEIDAEQQDLDAELDNIDVEQDALNAEANNELDDGEENDDVAGDGDVGADVEVLDESGESVKPAQPSRDGLATYTMREGPYRLKIIPQSTKSGLTWSLWLFLKGSQGPVLQTTSGVSVDQADEIGLSESTRREANRLLSEARDRLDLPAGFSSETSSKSFSDLEKVLDEK